jgi:hypothetical protein
MPLRLKPVPLIPACEIVTLEPPILVIVPERVGLLPTVTLPNASLVGLVLSWPWDVVVPVPESVRVVTVFEASLVMVTVALKSPPALGANSMVIGTLCPAPMVTGRLGAVREKYLVEIVALLTVTDAVPELVALTVRVLLPPAATLPKFKLESARERLLLGGGFEVVLAALKPIQPTRKVRPASRSSVPATLPRCFERIL